MIIHSLIQGTHEWDLFRLNHNGASEAAAMLGISSKVKRTELLHMKHTGIAKEFSDWVQENILDHGHVVEALARTIVEREIVGESLYPVTCSEGKLSASCDGLTMDEETAFEHKQYNKALYDSVSVGRLPEEYMPQCQQIMMVTGAKRVIFVVSDGTLENMTHMAVLPDASWQERIAAGWSQFEKDLAAYVPTVDEVKPVGRTPETLPALHVEVTGMVTASNLAAYKEHAMAVFAGINRNLQSDQDFADAEKIVKWCSDVESRLDAAKEHALSQTQSIDELFKAIDDIKAESRRTRLELDKLVTKRKDEIRIDIVTKGIAEYAEHLTALQSEISPARINAPVPDFAGSIKGKRSLDSMRDAVSVALANGKIAADAQAKAIRANLSAFHIAAKDYEFLFSDLAQLVHKAADDFALAVQARITDHKATEAKREEETRERIRAEEQAKADKAARDKLAAEQAASAAELAAAKGSEGAELSPAAQALYEAEGAANFAKAHPKFTHEDVVKVMMPATVRKAIAAPAPAATSEPTLKLGEISTRLGFTVTADFLHVLGFDPAKTERASKLFHESDFPLMCQALIAHIVEVSEQFDTVAA